MPHFITDTCIGCTACATMCPTEAITGERQELHIIDPELCIDCAVCGNVCPVECILDATGQAIPKVKMKDRAKADVIPELCTGCDFCVEICPYEAISLDKEYGYETGPVFTPIAVVDEDKCTGCRLCEESCIKNAIIVDGAFDRTNVVIKQYGNSVDIAVGQDGLFDHRVDLDAAPRINYPVGMPDEQIVATARDEKLV